MAGYMVARIILTLCDIYVGITFIYILMSWIPNMRGVVEDIYNALGRICDPYLNLFRRIIPPLGMVDFSPIIAIIVLQIVVRLIVRLLVSF